MVKPDDREILSVLEKIASEEVASRVSEWIGTDEGLQWLSEHSDYIFGFIENGTLSFPDVPSDELFEKVHQEIRKRGAVARRRRILWRVAAVLIPLIAISAAWADITGRAGFNIFSEPVLAQETAKMGERKVMVFQDGTKVHLNAGAGISYPQVWRLDRRTVDLTGEAFFQVVSDHVRQFTVNVYGTKIKVHGTSFNVRAYPDDPTIDVTLLEGSVSFEADGKNYDMSPSEQLVYNKYDKTVNIRKTDDPALATLWTRNILIFRDNTLKEVTDVLGRWYDVEFVISDESLLSRSFTFRTPQLPLHSLLDEMEYISDLKFVREGEKVTVSEK